MIGECRGWMPVMGGLKQRGRLVKRKGNETQGWGGWWWDLEKDCFYPHCILSHLFLATYYVLYTCLPILSVSTQYLILFLGQSVCANAFWVKVFVPMSHDHHLSKYSIITVTSKLRPTYATFNCPTEIRIRLTAGPLTFNCSTKNQDTL